MISNKKRQERIDKEKWELSQQWGVDFCGRLPICIYCKLEKEYPCAKAYNRSRKIMSNMADK